MFLSPKLHYLLLFFVLFSCSSKKEHEPGTDFSIPYENEKVWKDCKFIGKDDSAHYRYHCKLYYRTGQLMEEGDFLNDSFPVGWHTHYRRDGSVKNKQEWWQVSSTQIALNRVLAYSKSGILIPKESNYYELKLSADTVTINQTMQVAFMLTTPYFKENKLYVFLFSDNDSTPFMLQSESNFVTWTTTPQKTGRHRLHGYFEELNVLDQVGDSLKVQGRKLYFSRDYFVID